MLIHKGQLQQMLLFIVAQRIEQGCDLDAGDFSVRIESAADSYDALVEIAVELRSPPLREDWPYNEPLAWADIVAQSAHLKPRGCMA